jgi:hypothetical protein
MNFLGYICQMKTLGYLSLLTIIFLSCTRIPTEDLDLKNSQLPQPGWFDTDKKYTIKDSEANPKVHAFFDMGPFVNVKERSLFFTPLTPYGSKAIFDIDLKSGQPYQVRRLCKQSDAWERFSKYVFEPNFTEGFIPRFLDRRGRPQRIITFGREKFYADNRYIFAQRVRIVGSVLLQECRQVPCHGSDGWETIEILVAVDPLDSKMKDVNTIDQLKKLRKVDWEYTNAYLQTARGKNVYENSKYPAYRIVGERDPYFSIKSMLRGGRLFKLEERKQIRAACEKLYTFLWEKIGQPRFKKGKDHTDSYRKKVFLDNFSKFNMKFGKRFSTCTEYVQPTDIAESRVKHWFFSYIDLFYKFQQLGYTYACGSKGWAYNPKNFTGKFTYDGIQSIKNCKAHELEHAFDAAVLRNQYLSQDGSEHFRYVEYDSVEFGTTRKLYSWIRDNGTKVFCKDDDRTKKVGFDRIFPYDVSWKDLDKYYYSNKIYHSK